jgi:hypothetical protein
MRGSGKGTRKMGLGSILSLMGHIFMVSTKMELDMEKGNTLIARRKIFSIKAIKMVFFVRELRFAKIKLSKLRNFQLLFWIRKGSILMI